MASKRIEVLRWLDEDFKDLEIPSFEKSEANINQLYKLMVAHKENQKDLATVNNYVEDAAAFDEAYEKSVEKSLKNLGISDNFFDLESQGKLDCLAAMYNTLNIRNFSSSNIMLALNDLEEEDSKVEESLKQEENFTNNLLQLSKSIADNIEQLNNVSETAKEQLERRDQEQRQEERRHCFNKEKMKKYQSDIKTNQMKLSKVGFEDKVSLSTISKKVEEVSNIKKTLDEKKTDLENYSALPPDVVLAEVKVEEMKQRLEDTLKHIVHSYSSQN